MNSKRKTVMKTKEIKLKFVRAKIAQAVMSVGALATVMSCTLIFHEKEIPNELLKNHPFAPKIK